MDFNKQVIEKSYERPVVVDFWAEWCGPCRILGPVIEQIAKEQKDKWTLVKVDTEENYEVSMQYQIRSIPNVKMFHKGEVIAEFAGALPHNQILEWLEENLPDAGKDQINTLIEKVRAHAATEEDVVALEMLLAEKPEMTEARVALAQYFVFTRPERALDMVDSVKMSDKFSDLADDIKELARLMTFSGNGESPAAPKLQDAQKAFRKGQLEAGIQQLIDAVSLDKNCEGDLPRKAGIAIFRLLGAGSELTKKYRWKFDMAIY